MFLLKFLQRTKNRPKWVNSWHAVSECATQLRSWDPGRMMRNVWAHVEIFWNWRRSLGSFSQKEHLRSRRFSTVIICSSGDLEENNWDRVSSFYRLSLTKPLLFHCISPKSQSKDRLHFRAAEQAQCTMGGRRPTKVQNWEFKMNNNEHTYSTYTHTAHTHTHTHTTHTYTYSTYIHIHTQTAHTHTHTHTYSTYTYTYSTYIHIHTHTAHTHTHTHTTHTYTYSTYIHIHTQTAHTHTHTHTYSTYTYTYSTYIHIHTQTAHTHTHTYSTYTYTYIHIHTTHTYTYSTYIHIHTQTALQSCRTSPVHHGRKTPHKGTELRVQNE